MGLVNSRRSNNKKRSLCSDFAKNGAKRDLFLLFIELSQSNGTPSQAEKEIYSNAFISSMYSALCVILHVPKSGSGDLFRMFAKASKNSGIFVATILPAILPKFSEPMCSEPPSTRMKATVGFLSTSFTAPWKPHRSVDSRRCVDEVVYLYLYLFL